MENPKIRFKGFTKDWEQRKLGELVKEGILEAPLDGNHGEKHPTSDEYVDSGIPFLMASDIHNGEVNIYSCKYITKERAERLDKGFARNGDVLLTHKATIGETAILSNLMTEYAMLTPQVTYYRIKNEERLNREYLYSFFNSLDFQTELKTKAAQSTRPYIGITAQQNLKIILPAEIDEQIRIGLYFRNLDHLITLHQRKCDQTKNLKKYMLQKMFPQNGAKVPEIRFDGYTYDWEQRKLIDYLEVSSEKNRDNRFTKDDVLSVSGEYGIVNQIEFQGRSFAGASVSNYGVVENGDVVYTKSPLKSNPYGIIKTNKGIPGIVSTLYAVYKPKEITDSKFVQIYFELDSRMNSYMHPLVNKGAKNDMKVSAENALKGMVSFPKKDEQEMISLYFSNLDHLITLHQRKCDELKKMKKYMLQNMFI